MNRILAVAILFSSFFAEIICALPQGKMASQDSAKIPRGSPRGASLGITTCAVAETATNAAASNAVPDMATVDAMSGLAFEKLVDSLLARQGYEVGNMRASDDYGVDMIINKDNERIAVQVKRSKNKITRKAISDAVAGMKYYNCTQAMVVTNSEFTEDAREFARGTKCILIDRTILQQWLDSCKMASGSHPNL